MFRKMIIGVLAVLSLTLGLMGGPATAGPVAITDGLRVDVSFKGKKPTKATLIVAGKRYPLKRKGKVWRTKPISAETVASMAGVKAKIKAKIGGKNKTLRITVQGGSTTPPPGTPGTPGGGSQPLFAAPGVDRVGNEAWEAVKGISRTRL